MTPKESFIERINTLSLDEVSPQSPASIKESLDYVLKGIDEGIYRAAEPDPSKDDGWLVNAWVKKALLMAFRVFPFRFGTVEQGAWHYYDKFPLKTAQWDANDFQSRNLRLLPGSVMRYPCFLGKNVIAMPSFVNVGAFVDDDTLIDTWATVGSCAQIGKRVHISGGAGIGGVLEPMQACPVVIEDDCFIGARCEIAEGMIIKKGAVIAMGTMLGASTVLIERETGKTFPSGIVPAYSVVVPGSRPSKGGVHLSCAVIVKKVDAKTREKTSINQLLRDL